MAIINLKFTEEMSSQAVAGRKITTARGSVKGELEDEFVIWSTRFSLIDIQPMPLATIRDQFYRLEGFRYPETFEQYWKNVLKKQWSDSEIKYLHFFGRVEE